MQGDTDTNTALRAEMVRVVSEAPFTRSPILCRLLIWLVDQTCLGRADNIKSYVVAVDGLGMASDFDEQNDAYPRVQLHRLRRGLEQHYANEGQTRQRCLHIPAGTYRVELADREVAYPVLISATGNDQMAGIARDWRFARRIGGRPVMRALVAILLITLCIATFAALNR